MDCGATAAGVAVIDDVVMNQRAGLQQQRAAGGAARGPRRNARDLLAQQRLDGGKGEQVVGAGEHGGGALQ